MKIETLTWTTPQVSLETQAAIRADVLQRNADRLRAGLPSLDVERQVEEEIEELRDAFYHDRLQPYIEAFYRTTPGKPGLPMRVVQHIEVHRRAEEALRREQGIVRPRPVAFDLIKFIGMYERGQLGGWGGAFSPIQTEN